MIDWSKKRLAEITTFIKDGTHGTHSDVSDGIALLSAKDIQDGSVVFKDARLISQEEFNKIHSKYCIKNGDVLLTIVGSLGRAALVENYIGNYTFQRSVAIIRPNQEVLSKFLFYVFQSDYFQCELQKKESKGAQGGVYLGEISKLKIDTPCVPEQQAIVRVMRDFDDYLEKVQKKLEASRHLKKGLAQQIFSGKLRFKDGNGQDFHDWNEMKIKEIALIKKGEQLSRTNMIDDGDIPVINGGILASGYTNKSNVNAETITISEGGNSCGYVNYIKENFWLGGHCYAILNKQGISKLFLYHFLKHNEENIMKLRVGSGLPNIQKKDLDNYHILVPDISEQQKIADLLSNIDKLIGSLERLQEKARIQKKWLLDNLVTGKIRLKEFRDE